MDDEIALIWAHIEARAAIDCIMRLERHYGTAGHPGLAKTAFALRRQLEGLSKLTREWATSVSHRLIRALKAEPKPTRRKPTYRRNLHRDPRHRARK